MRWNGFRTCSEDEAQQKYETVICNSLRGLDLFLKYYFQMISTKKANRKSEESAASASNLEKPTNFYEKLNTLIFDQKFWKYSRDSSSKIKTEFFQLLSSMIDVILLSPALTDPLNADESLVKFYNDLKAKLVPLVFYACDDCNCQVSQESSKRRHVLVFAQRQKDIPSKTLCIVASSCEWHS